MCTACCEEGSLWATLCRFGMLLTRSLLPQRQTHSKSICFSLYPLPLPAPLSLSKPSCWEKNPDHSALPGCCSICGYWIAFCVWQPFLVNWHSTPCAAPNVICYISICSSCRFFWMKSLSVCLLNVSPSPVSIFSLTHGSFPAALKCIQNKWCTKDSLNTAKQL